MTTKERKEYIEANSYLLSYSAEQHLLENEDSFVCSACSWSWYYDNTNSPKCGSCNGKWYVNDLENN